ncbi:MAG TPA: CAP domain-containing protein [Steroidobacteraceae bacterium]
MLTLAAALPVQTARSAPLNAVNFDRLHGCGAGVPRQPLFFSTRLSNAAKRLADGSSLQPAMISSGYLAAESAALHLSGAASDADIQRVLAAHYCKTVQDPRMQEFGVERRGDEVWMVLAAPAPVPAANDEGSASRRVLEFVNEARASGRRCGAKYYPPVPPLALDAALTRAALAHSRDMAAHDAFDHRGGDGSTPGMRVERAGFGEHRIVGENIAAGAMTAAEVTQGWLASPAHCENIMDGRFTLIGIGYAENLRTRSAVFWTQDFAARP